MSKFYAEASAYRLAVGHGIIPFTKAVSWADDLILADDDHSSELYDLSLAADLNTAVSALSALVAFQEFIKDDTVKFAFQLFAKGTTDYKGLIKIARAMEEMEGTDITPSKDAGKYMFSARWVLEDAHAGHYGCYEEVAKEFISFVEKYACFT